MDSVFLFPGQGSQFVGMGKDLAEAFPTFARTIEEASDTLGFDVATLCFADPENQLAQTPFTQPAILSVSTGIARVLAESSELRPSVVAGHSLGEYSALVAVGALSFPDALRAVRFRGEAMESAAEGGSAGMAAYVGASADEVARLCAELSREGAIVEVANYNAPTQLVLSGHKSALRAVEATLAERRLGSTIPLKVSTAFHSSLMGSAARALARHLARTSLGPFEAPLVAGGDAVVHDATTYGTRELVEQVVRPVRWSEVLRTIERRFPSLLTVEVGPGMVLTKLLKKNGVERAGVETGTARAVQALLSWLDARRSA